MVGGVRWEDEGDREHVSHLPIHRENLYRLIFSLLLRLTSRPFSPLQVENHDFAREDKAPQHVPPWARAEVRGPLAG